MPFAEQFLQETMELVGALDTDSIDALANHLGRVRDDGGRLFILGVGGSAGHASHAVNDFRKICGFESYAPTDNVSELTARTNDEGYTVEREQRTAIGPPETERDAVDLEQRRSIGGARCARRRLARGCEPVPARGRPRHRRQ